ncbi:MAG: aspartyl-phosphate phosphatase Spo0E family protein [Bacillota bacterium]|nr:aspartyl-phosphate phosphatase Spo0E family protein [Bacillota bacterium]
MSYNVMTLLDAIENLRHQLNNFANINNLTDPEVLSLSQRLDKLLNDYNSNV